MEEKKERTKSKLQDKQEQLNTYVQYSGLAVQIITIVIIGVLAGKWLDKKLELEKAYATIFFTLFSILAALYYLVKKVKK